MSDALMCINEVPFVYCLSAISKSRLRKNKGRCHFSLIICNLVHFCHILFVPRLKHIHIRCCKSNFS